MTCCRSSRREARVDPAAVEAIPPEVRDALRLACAMSPQS
jgi:hypothetical protein